MCRLAHRRLSIVSWVFWESAKAGVVCNFLLLLFHLPWPDLLAFVQIDFWTIARHQFFVAQSRFCTQRSCTVQLTICVNWIIHTEPSLRSHRPVICLCCFWLPFNGQRWMGFLQWKLREPQDARRKSLIKRKSGEERERKKPLKQKALNALSSVYQVGWMRLYWCYKSKIAKRKIPFPVHIDRITKKHGEDVTSVCVSANIYQANQLLIYQDLFNGSIWKNLCLTNQRRRVNESMQLAKRFFFSVFRKWL